MWRFLGRSRRVISRFQHFSDPHIDRNGIPRLTAAAPYLLIAGDLGNGWPQKTESWLKDLSKEFDRVVVVPGNHDFYGAKSLKDRVSQMKDTQSRVPNLEILIGGETAHFPDSDLDNESDGTPVDVLVYGDTFWSHIPTEHHDRYATKSPDFRNIPGLTPVDFNRLHEEASNQLFSFFWDGYPHQKVPTLSHHFIPIILTHHAPMIRHACHSDYCRTPARRLRHLNHGFASDCTNELRHLAFFHPIWIFGHTHYRMAKSVPGFNFGEYFYVTSNPVGFPKLPKTLSGPKIPVKTLEDVGRWEQIDLMDLTYDHLDRLE